MRGPFVTSIAASAVLLSVSAPAEDGAPADSSRALLEEELDALWSEIQEPVRIDPFESGRSPDLIVVSSNTVLGEVSPCG